MKNALEHFQSNNCVYDDNKKNKKCNMKKWYHCHQYRVQNDLETFVEMKICKLFLRNKMLAIHYNLSANVFLTSYGIDLLGIPERNLSGRRTRKARNAFASKPLISRMDNAMSKNLKCNGIALISIWINEIIFFCI